MFHLALQIVEKVNETKLATLDMMSKMFLRTYRILFHKYNSSDYYMAYFFLPECSRSIYQSRATLTLMGKCSHNIRWKGPGKTFYSLGKKQICEGQFFSLNYMLLVVITTITHLLNANNVGTQSTSLVLMEAFCYEK